MRIVNSWLGAAAASIGVYTQLVHSDPNRLYWFAAFVVMALAGLAFGVRRLERPGPWIPLAGGMGVLLLGDVVYRVLETRSDVSGAPFPSLADVFYLFSYGLIVVGVVIAAADAGYPNVRRGLGFALLIAVAAMRFFWSQFAGETWSFFDGSAGIVATAYPVLAALLLGAAGFVLVATDGIRTQHVLLAIGACVFAAGDFVYNLALTNGTFAQGGLEDAFWLFAFALFAAAALGATPSRHTAHSGPTTAAPTTAAPQPTLPDVREFALSSPTR